MLAPVAMSINNVGGFAQEVQTELQERAANGGASDFKLARDVELFVPKAGAVGSAGLMLWGATSTVIRRRRKGDEAPKAIPVDKPER